MIHYRRTRQIAPGRQADAIRYQKGSAAIFKDVTGNEPRVSVVTTGSLGVICYSVDVESWAAYGAKLTSDQRLPAWFARLEKEEREGTSPFVPGTLHDEIWRYS